MHAPLVGLLSQASYQHLPGTVSGSRNIKTAEERLRQMDELEDLEPTEQIVQLFMDALRETTER